jgi:protein-S-isoprenylcysteine O-methyltransferase Ste14
LKDVNQHVHAQACRDGIATGQYAQRTLATPKSQPWAITTIRRAGTRVETYKPTAAIVENGPYRFTRNPIYLGMFLGQAGLATGFNSAWILAMLVPFYFVIRFGVIAREEAYLEHKFGEVYLAYKSRVRRWL